LLAAAPNPRRAEAFVTRFQEARELDIDVMDIWRETLPSSTATRWKPNTRARAAGIQRRPA